MPGIFDDERRGSGPMAPDPGGTGRFFARAASRAPHGDPTPPRRPLLTLRPMRLRSVLPLLGLLLGSLAVAPAPGFAGRSSQFTVYASQVSTATDVEVEK